MLSRFRRSISPGLLVLAGFVAVTVFWQYAVPASAETGVTVPAAHTHLKHPGQGPQEAVLAGGCFWGMQMVFEHVKGVTHVVSGYAGGSAGTANYQASSSGLTNQAESVRITYDPGQITYSQLLRIYFSVAHDPTQINRQGPDTGHEYRSEIFALNAAQARVAKAYIKQLNHAGVFDKPIATQVARLEISHFYPAEAYHQNYGARHPDSLYIRINDAPKVAALKQRFHQFYRSSGSARITRMP